MRQVPPEGRPQNQAPLTRRKTIAACILSNGLTEALPAPPERSLPPTPIWRIQRATHAIQNDLRVVQTLEDTPFYARSVLRAGDHGAPILHESLDLERFRSAWVRTLLPFRMPRRSG
jgi:carotenoid 1,2-hydratase